LWRSVSSSFDSNEFITRSIYPTECSLPLEYCEYGPDPERCREWLERTLPDLLNQMQASSNSSDDKSGERKRQTRGGKGMPKGKKKFEAQKIVLNKQQRKGNKFVTIVQGLASNEVDIELARKFFAQKFSCGCSKSGDDELTIQGDVVSELIDLLPEKWNQVYSVLFI
jgi:density-regulated protein DRP1